MRNIFPGNQDIAGFTLLEVLVSIALTATFVSLAMQGMSVAAILQSRAIQSAEAANWIQSDLETLHLQTSASQIPFDPLRCHAQQSQQGFAQALLDKLASNASPSLRQSRTGQKFTLDRQLLVEPSTPFNILGVRYAVQPQNGSPSILNFYTEVIPDAAFTCE
jgi:prepilin-type N-terminal cleavage/methylation domain-containing protein